MTKISSSTCFAVKTSSSAHNYDNKNILFMASHLIRARDAYKNLHVHTFIIFKHTDINKLTSNEQKSIATKPPKTGRCWCSFYALSNMKMLTE